MLNWVFGPVDGGVPRIVERIIRLEGTCVSGGFCFAFCLYLLALAPRLAFVLAAGRGDLSLDEIEYHLLAMNLAEGEGFRWFFDFRSSFRPPGLPFLLAPLYWVFGPNFFLARIFQSLLGASIGVCTWLLARQMMPERPARWAGVCAALYPPLVCFSVALMSENIFIPLFVLLLYGLLRLSQQQSRSIAARWGAFCGVLAGSAILLRPELTYLLPLLSVWVLWRRTQWRIRALGVGVLVAIVFVMVAPWSVRNSLLNGRFVYLDTRTGYNLYIGYNTEATGTFDLRQAQDPIHAYMEMNLNALELPEPITEAEAQELLYRELMAYKFPEALDYPLRNDIDPDAAVPDIAMHDWAMARVKEFVWEQPLRALLLIPVKFAYFWDLEHRVFLFAYSNGFIGAVPRPVLAVFLLLLLSPFVALVLLSIPGAVYGGLAPRHLALLLLPVGYYSLLHALTFGEARFHYVLIPVLCILAAAGARHLRMRESGGDLPTQSRARRLIACALVLMFLAVWAHGLYVSRERWQAVFSENGHQSGLEF